MPFADLHCDTVSRLLAARRMGDPACLRREPRLHLDLERLKENGTVIQNFALFVHLERTEDPLAEVLTLADLYETELEKNQDIAQPVRTFADLEKARQTGRVGCVLTGEEGEVCRGELPLLRTLFRLGMRMATLTWNFPNCLAMPNGQPGGLTARGRAAVEEMEELGMVVDVSHLGDDGFWDVADMAKKPFAASHSCCRALWPHRRNLTDDMIRAVADHGGVVGVNFYAGFLGSSPVSRLDDVARHLRHIIDVGGEGAAALGSDYDGIDSPLEWGHAGRMACLPEALRRRGFTEREIDGLCWRNAWAMYRETLPRD